MRVLLHFACGFATAVLLAICLLPIQPALVLAVFSLILSVFLCIRRNRIGVSLFGVAIGLVWTLGYQFIVLKPTMSFVDQTLEITGTVTDYSVKTTYGIRVPADISNGREAVKAMVWLYSDEMLKPGDKFSVLANIQNSAEDGNNYYRADGIYLLAFGKGKPKINRTDRVPFRYFPRQIAHSLELSLQNCVSEDVLGYAVALTTGNREYLTNLERESLKVSGIYHALSLSGMHMTVLVGSLSLLIRKKTWKAFVGIPVSIAFTIITGASASIVRAAVMQCLVLIAPLFRREADAPTSIGAAALFLMLQNPFCILGWGMQLSFASMAGILLLSDRIYRYLNGLKQGKKRKTILTPLRHSILSSLSATGAATAFATPLLMAYFGMISLVAPLTNLLTGWMITWCFRGSLLTALVGMLSEQIGTVLGWCLGWCIRYVQMVAYYLSKLPFASLGTDSVYGFGWVILVYAVMLVTMMIPRERRRLVIPGCCITGGLVICLIFTMLQNQALTLTVLDVGQGQCLILSNGNQTVLVDCGGSLGEASGDLAAEELMKVGENHVDALILTHYDSDHSAGVIELLSRISVSTIILPNIEPKNENRQDIETFANNHDVGIYYVATEAQISFADGSICVFPPVGPQDEDNLGLSVLCDVGEIQILVTGDIDKGEEHLLLKAYDIPDVDILIAGHHGSKYSTSEELLATVKPEIVIISVGKNSYGHPADETLKRITQCGAVIYRTDLYGTVKLKGT